MPCRGAYFLASDKVLDLAIAFLNSFRRFNPAIPLCCIPFDSNTREISALAEHFDFTIFQDQCTLNKCDQLSREFFQSGCGQFRKLSMWQGDFSEFVYIDVDTIVLSNINFAFSFLKSYDFIASHSRMPLIRKWVWKDTIYDAGHLTPEQISYSANTGFMVSKQHMFTWPAIQELLPQALGMAPHMELLCAEQPFLNYLVITSGKAYSSLWEIARRTRRIDIPLERWAGAWVGYIREGTVVRPPTHPPFLLLHWAGEWQRGQHKHHPLWRYYRDLRSAPSALPNL